MEVFYPFISILNKIGELILGFYSFVFEELKNFVLSLNDYSVFEVIWKIFTSGGWIVFAFVFAWGFWNLWLNYVQGKYASKVKWILLSIKVPKDNKYPPQVAEKMFTHLASAKSGGNFIDRYFKGVFQLSLSFEIVCLNGRIKYFVYVPQRLRHLVESAIYSAYPEAEISLVSEDYTIEAPTEFPNEKYNLWGTELTLYKEDCYPIRTYPAFEFPSIKEFIDPLSSLWESLGKFGSGERGWIQIIITPISQDWKKQGEKLIAKLTKEKQDEEASKTSNTKVIEGIQRKISKIGFRTKIRLIYFAPKEVFDKGKGVSALLGVFNQFSTLDMNGFKPYSRVSTGADYFFVKKRIAKKQERIIQNYIKRSAGAGAPGFILNVEELASIYHYPVKAFMVPPIERTSSRRGAPPPNLALDSWGPLTPDQD